MRTDDFDYPLPDELIAQRPAEPRDSCRLLVLHREDGDVEHRRFTDLIDYLEPGDLLVINETRVSWLRERHAAARRSEIFLEVRSVSIPSSRSGAPSSVRRMQASRRRGR